MTSQCVAPRCSTRHRAVSQRYVPKLVTQFGGGGGGGFVSSPTHDERSKNRNSSAVSCCVIGSCSGFAVPHSAGKLPLPPPFDTCKSLNTARPHWSVALIGALNDRYAVPYALLERLALP